MFKNYLKIAFRNIWKNRTASGINILGLGLGLACCFLIVIYVQHERQYDTFHSDLDRIYRLNYHITFAGDINHARIPPTVSSKLTEYFPEVETSARMYPRGLSVQVVKTDQQMEIQNAFFADSTITDILGFDFIYGQAETALKQPFSVALSESVARQLFGQTDVIDETIQLAGSDQFRVTAVFQDWPDQAHLDLGMLVSYENMIDVEPSSAHERLAGVLANNWIATHSYTYAKLKPEAKVEKVNERMADFLQTYGDERFKDGQNFSLFPVRDIHLKSEVSGENKASADTERIRLFLAIGIITLLIAIFNFVNLSTASSLTRTREVGMRKILGAKRAALFGQFMGESLLMSALAFIISLVVVQLALSPLSSLTGLALDFSPFRNGGLLLAFAGILLLTGLLAGSYPAFFMSGFRPLAVLQGRSSGQKPGGTGLRKVLMTAQFALAIAFISGAGIVYLQLRHLQNQPLGFQQDLIINLPLNSQNNINSVFRPGDASIRQRMNAFDEALLQNKNIAAVTQSSGQPGMGAVQRNVWTEKVLQTDNYFAPIYSVDYDFIQTFEIEMAAGRGFDLSFGTDHLSSFVINETAAKNLQWENPSDALNQRLVVEGKEGQVIGVVKDYHQSSLYNEIEPLIMEVAPGAFGYFSVKVEAGDLSQTLAFVEDKWQSFFPNKAFEYHFLDETLRDLYQNEARLGTLTSYAAFLAIFLSCFGLFGLAALLTKRRFREIGIRKVLGANVRQILGLLAKDFVVLIGFALLIAVPLCWYFLNDWINGFPYSINFPWWLPFSVGFVVLLLAFVTVSSQSLRAALSNPVDAIRQE